MITDVFVWVVCALAVVPLLMTVWNLFEYRRPAVPNKPLSARGVSILIPARNEEAGIRQTLEAALRTTGVEFEIVVLDDQSEDGTAQVVREFSDVDPRVRLENAVGLPAGWCGKQHACLTLAEFARFDVFVFLDADVRLKPDAVVRAVGFLEQSQAALVSGVPFQRTVTFGERLLLPLIHFVLLGYLPVWRMRRCTRPAYAAGCGQLFVTHRSDYEAIGGHAGLRDSLHDGVKLPRWYREHGLKTDLFDATEIATCRMYESSRAVWNGLGKNATEGLAASVAIWVWTFLLFGGHVLPFLCLLARSRFSTAQLLIVVAACVASFLTRLVMTVRFRQSWLGLVLHPLGVTVLLAIQWQAWLRRLRGVSSEWRGRSYGPIRSDRTQTRVDEVG